MFENEINYQKKRVEKKNNFFFIHFILNNKESNTYTQTS
jgi:hypothetical protein